jgi:hypothetical protein
MHLQPHDLYRLAMALEGAYCRALRARFPKDSAYIRARYEGSGDPRIEAMARRTQAAIEAWRVANRRVA